MLRNVEMRDLTPLVQEDDKAVKITKGRSWKGKEIDADDVPGVIGEESLPILVVGASKAHAQVKVDYDKYYGRTRWPV